MMYKALPPLPRSSIPKSLVQKALVQKSLVRKSGQNRLFSSIGLAAILPCVFWLTGCAGISSGGLGSNTLNPQLSASLAPGTVGAPYAGTITASGGKAPYVFAMWSGQLPEGLGLDQSTGTISGTPSATGTFSFEVQVTDSTGMSGSQSFQISVSVSGAVEVTITPATASVPSDGTQQFGATVTNNADTAVTWTAAPGTISSDGLYQAPAVTANTSATVTATSVADPTKLSSASFTITVPSGSPLVISTTSLSSATAGTAYSSGLAASGGTAPYIWSLASGTLPTGIALQGNGLLSGTTSQTGQFNITMQAVDSSSPKQSATQPLTLTVNASGSITVTVSPSGSAIYSAQAVQFTASVANTSNLAVTWSASPGVVSSSGAYTSPTVTRNTTATITATSVADPTKSGTATLTIVPTSQISITTATLAGAAAGAAYSVSLAATGGTTPYTWSLASGTWPTGITLQGNGLISGTTSQTGNFNITAKVSDSSGSAQTATKPLTLTVNSSGSITVTVTPSPIALYSSSTRGFTATVANSSNTAVTWTTTLGSISSNGNYTAPAVTLTATATITATSVADPSKFGTAAVTIVPTQSSSLAITTTSVASAIVGTAYSAALSAAGGTAPYSWSVTSGTLPGGITLASSGVLSGTSPQTGAFNFTVQATDSSSPKNTATQALTLTVNASSEGNLAPSTLFGFNTTKTAASDYPTVSYKMQRFWDSEPLQWPSINTASGVFNFSNLDATLAQAYSSGIVGFYTLARTPPWATSKPGDTSCSYTTSTSGGGNGECDPPSDLNSDGTGANAIWKAWITAIATHVNDSTYLQTHAHIKYWEIWNEPDALIFWTGSFAQLARLTEDANCIITGRGVIHENGDGTATPCTATPIDTTAQIVMASGHASSSQLVFAQNQLYCDASPTGIQLPCPNPGNAVASVIDIVNFHMKPGDMVDSNNCPSPCSPETVMQLWLSGINGMLQPAELAKPIWNGEGAYAEGGFADSYTDPDMQASFMPRFYLINWSLNISGIAWYDWYNLSTLPVEVQNSYQQTYNWLSASSLTTPCTANGTIWSCGITKSGAQYLIMWDTAQSCSAGSCSTPNEPVGTEWSTYQDMTTASTPLSISGNTIPLGVKPVVLH